MADLEKHASDLTEKPSVEHESTVKVDSHGLPLVPQPTDDPGDVRPRVTLLADRTAAQLAALDQVVSRCPHVNARLQLAVDARRLESGCAARLCPALTALAFVVMGRYFGVEPAEASYPSAIGILFAGLCVRTLAARV